MSSFSKLNEDVFVSILLLLTPSDIMSVRLTNKNAYLASKHRSVWYKALATRVREEGLFSFPYDRESMSTADLERFASFPSMIVSQRSPLNGMPLEPTAHRALQGPMSDDEIQSKELVTADDTGFESDFSDMTLVPGGRFLFTVSPTYPDERTYIKLWDLGRPGGAQAQVKLLAEHIYEPNYVRGHKISPTVDGRGIRFLVISMWHIVIFEIYPESSNPTFEFINCLDIDTDGDSDLCKFTFIGVHGNRIIISLSISRLVHQSLFRYFEDYKPPPIGHIVVWDFIEEQTATIHTGKIIINPCIVKDDHVVGVRDNTNEMFLWDLPEKEEWKQGGLFFRRKAPTTAPASAQLLSFGGAPDRILRGVRTLALPPRWFGDDPQPLQRLLSLYGSDSGDEVTVLNFDSGESCSPTPVRARIDWQSSGYSDHSSALRPNALQLCHQRITLQPQLSEPAHHIEFVSIPALNLQPSTDQSVPGVVCPNALSFSTGDFAMHNTSFCLVTGRCCSLGTRNAGGNLDGAAPDEVRVFDYL